MNIREIQFFTGRNIYSHRPVMKILLDLGERRLYRTDSIFAGRLLAMLPRLAEHFCSRRYPGGFVERLEEGTYLGHVIEHVFLELQSLAGMEAEYGKTTNREDELTEIICEYRCRQAVKGLALAAMRVVVAALDGDTVNLTNMITKARKTALRFLPGPSTEAILQAARKRDIPVQQLAEGSSLYRLGTGKYQKRIFASISEGTGCIAVEIAGNKPLTKNILEQHGLPVPRGMVVRSKKEACRAARLLGFPVVVKPDNGNKGKGVSLEICSSHEVEQAFEAAAAFSSSILIEKYISGRHYRLLVVGGELAAAAERIPAHVLGDGLHNIFQLVQQENNNPRRGNGHEKPLTKLKLDSAALALLAKQGLSPASVPKPGQQIWLRKNDNLSTGGTASDVTAIVHPLQAQLAVRAALAVGLEIAGVDLIMQDIGAAPDKQHGAIIEVNAAPGLRMHLFPSKGERRDIGQKIVELLFPPGTPCRVPVFSVTGTNGKTTTARMLDFALRRHGLYPGLCCTDGIYFNGELQQKGDLTGPASARMVLANPTVDVAVLETARGGIIRRGLGYDRADVAVICNLREDHLGQDGIENMDELVHVKSLVAEAVYSSGTVILNADDGYVNDFAAACWTEIIFFSMQADNMLMRRHLSNGGRAVLVRQGVILAAEGGRVLLMGRVRDFAVTLGGRAVHQVENLLAALAALWAYGLAPRKAGQYLRDFANALSDNPGRANIYDVDGIRVLVDYGHNADGILKLGQLAKKLKANRLIGVVGVPGDRCDALIVLAGKAAGHRFDYLIIKEDQDLRGRQPGEAEKLLLRGALAAGMARESIYVQREERLAVRKALSMASPGDLVVIFYEKLEQVLAEVVPPAADAALQLPQNQDSPQEIGLPGSLP
ncbi:MAG: cyanophycin synthetase [Dethiobacter sp.]|jgi:cyanophycin synthetase|nr:cyanophycin synthetase [Dethiobacter sp.]